MLPQFRAAGGPDVPANRTTLCWFHHREGVHEGRVRLSARAPDRLLFDSACGPRPRRRALTQLPRLSDRSADICTGAE